VPPRTSWPRARCALAAASRKTDRRSVEIAASACGLPSGSVGAKRHGVAITRAIASTCARNGCRQASRLSQSNGHADVRRLVPNGHGVARPHTCTRTRRGGGRLHVLNSSSLSSTIRCGRCIPSCPSSPRTRSDLCAGVAAFFGGLVGIASRKRGTQRCTWGGISARPGASASAERALLQELSRLGPHSRTPRRTWA
jgi:hypothetical protein